MNGSSRIRIRTPLKIRNSREPKKASAALASLHSRRHHKEILILGIVEDAAVRAAARGPHALDERVDGREGLGALVRLDAKADAGKEH